MFRIRCSNWNEIEREIQNGNSRGAAILIGNGFAINFSKKFRYQALLDVAKEQGCLEEHDISVFQALDASNFEEVLRILSYSEQVCRCYGLDNSSITDATERIRKALIESIAYVHKDLDPSNNDGLKKSLECVAKHLENRYKRVYTTNYDFILYWSCFDMKYPLKDFFWNDSLFDVFNAELRSERDRALYFLHGALHIFRKRDGRTYKVTRKCALAREAAEKSDGIREADEKSDSAREADEKGYLIDAVKTEIKHGDSLPLFVSAGDSKGKMRQIRGSDYLTFCYHSFAADRRPLVVLGHSLSDADEHIAEAIFKGKRSKLYVSYYDEDAKEDLSRRLEKCRSKWKNNSLEIVLFRAEEHPLIRCADALKANRSDS